MAKPTQPPIIEDEPLYIRWSPDRSTYAIELRLDLAPKIAAQVQLSERLGTEVGGFLIGTIPSSPVPTLRIESIEMLSNGSDDDTVFLPEPGRFQPSSQARGEHKSGAEMIGFFRSHARVGPMKPSLADRSIFAQEFQSKPYVVLLVQTEAPHRAAFFVSNNGKLTDEPSVREFAFDENEFKALPEVPGEIPQREPSKDRGRTQTSKWSVYARVAALLLIGIGACALLWSFMQQPNLARWFGSGNQMHLAVLPENHILRISWNHAASELNQASGGTLIISEGSSRSQLRLGMDDLRLGSVEYQGSGSALDVQLILNTPAGPVTADSVRWNGR